MVDIADKGRISRLVLLCESCAPFVLVGGVIDKAAWIYRSYPGALLSFHRMIEGTATPFQKVAFFSAGSDLVFIFYCLTILWGFLVRRNLRSVAMRPHEILVPVTNLLLLGYGYRLIDRFPKMLHFYLVPVSWIPPLALAGSLLVLFGFLLSTVALYQLRYSLSFLIEVRDGVFSGLYRYVRHPIYCGYLFVCLGTCLGRPTLAYFIFYLFVGVLFIYRAMLEERHMAAFSPAYKEYIERTPFLFPCVLSKRRKGSFPSKGGGI